MKLHHQPTSSFSLKLQTITKTPFLFPSGNEKGVALISVILVISLLTIFLVEFAYKSRVNFRIAANASHQIQAQFIARGGIDAAANILLYDSQQGNVDYYSSTPKLAQLTDLQSDKPFEEIWSWAAQGSHFTFPVGEGTLILQISDENSKLNLNLLEDPKWRQIAYRLFNNFISSAPDLESAIEATTLVDSIREWIDENQEIESNSQGLESDYYQNLNPPYSAKDGKMDSLSELIFIGRMNHRLYRHLMESGGPEAKNSDALGSPYITVFPKNYPASTININTAPQRVIEALHPTFSSALAKDIIEYRKESPFQSVGDFFQRFVPDSQARLELQNLISTQSQVFSVASTGVIQNIAVTIRAVLHRLPQENRVKILYWRVES